MSCRIIWLVVALLSASICVGAAPLPSGECPEYAPPLVRRLPAVPSQGVVAAAHLQPTDDASERWGEQPELLYAPTPASLLTEPTTLEDLQHLALANNPSLSRMQARIHSLQGKWVQAGLPPNPKIGYVGEDMTSSAAGQQGGFVSQQIIRGGKLQLQREVVAREIAETEQLFAAARQRVLTDVRTGFYDVLIAQRTVDTAADLLKINQQAIAASRRLFQAQEISRVDVLQSELEVDQALIVSRKAQNELSAAWHRLVAITGTPDMQPRRLDDVTEGRSWELHWDEALDTILTNSPEIAAAVARLDRARWGLQRARAEVIPDVNVQVAVRYGNAIDQTLTDVMVGMPLPILNRNQGGIQQACGEIAEAQHNIRRTELDLQRRLADKFNQYTDARYQAGKYSRDVLPKAKEALELVTEAYQQGEVGFLTFLTAQRTYFQTNLAYIAALRELWTSVAEIEGLLLQGSLE